MARQRLISALAFFASFFALGVIGLGAFTRLIDAGLGCPDWPGCYGHLTVPVSEKAHELISLHYPGVFLDVYKAWAEMIHRYFAGCLGFLILGIIFLIFKKEFRKRSNVILAICLFLLLAYQILLGQWTVTFKLLPIVVTQHLLGGFLILSTLWLIYLNNSVRSSPQPLFFKGGSGWIIVIAMIALIILFLQITLGAWTSTNYASLSCSDFPFCTNSNPRQTMHFKEAFNIFSPIGINYEGGVLPEKIRQTIQMTHRIGALVFTIYMLVFTMIVTPKLKYHFELMKSLYLIWSLIFAQLCIGIVNIIYKLPLATAIGHNLLAVVLLLSMITFIFKLVMATKKVYPA